jgi:hypothetical protein
LRRGTGRAGDDQKEQRKEAHGDSG